MKVEIKKRLLLKKSSTGKLIHIGENDSLFNVGTNERFARLIKKVRKK